MEDLKALSVKLKLDQARQGLLGHSAETVKVRSGQVILKPGEAVGGHNTEDKEEIIIILKGSAEIMLDENSVLTAEKDTLVYIPPRTAHNVKNTGSEPLRYVYITSKTG